jgi:hypothetical protein
MFTPSIVLLMIMNTIAASAAVFVALQASALEKGDGVPTATASFPRATGTAGDDLAQEKWNCRCSMSRFFVRTRLLREKPYLDRTA